jgi:hypothetical protein
MPIPARISIVTLGTHDFERMRAFYLGLGWHERSHYPDFSMFDIGGAWLALYPFGKLAEDGRVPAGAPSKAYRGFTLAINVETAALVDSTIDELRALGVTITKEPEDADWGGRSAYFADPEGNLWEVAWNPAVGFDARGALAPLP